MRRLLAGLGLAAAFAGCAQRPGDLLATSAPRRTASEVPRVRLLSLNTWLLPGFSKAMPERLARMPEALRAERPDVICLQEVWLPATRDTLAQALAPEYAASEGRAGGLLTLSRFPIVVQEFVPFAPVAGMSVEERLAGKGLLVTVLDAPGGRLRVVNTHLAHERPANHEHAAEMRPLLAGWTDLPLVLAGDLNRSMGQGPWNDAVELGRWHASGFSHADPVADGRWGDLAPGAPPPRPIPTRCGWPPDETNAWAPDHVLVRDAYDRSVSARGYRVLFTTADDALSDHRALLVELELAP
jgi:endonuclease/exonuclease/phosphatase family metal-dependent hydrolase